MTLRLMIKESDLTAEYFSEILCYSPETGDFVWKDSGNKAGWKTSRGYIAISHKRKNYMAHRLAWLLSHKKWPKNYIDHIDGNQQNNILSNLREATAAQNMFNRKISKNNKCGLKGVQFYRQTNKFLAMIQHNGKVRNLGYFESAYEAHNEYKKEATRLFGEFARFD